MRWKLLLRPSWLGLTAVVFVFAAACFTMLSPWQFGRHDERQTQNDAVEGSLSSDPRPLHEVLPDGRAPGEGTEWALVTITGHYLPEHEVVARLRTVQGQPAFEILTPLRTDRGETVLVDRGFVQPDQRVRVPPYAAPPTGEVTVTARARTDEVDPKRRPAFADASTDGRLHAYTINSTVVGKANGLSLRPGYFQLADGQPGVLGALPLPRTDAGPFFSYGLQWIAFGVMALFGWAYFTLRELKPGGALTERTAHQGAKAVKRRQSVAKILAEDEARERQADARTR